MRTKLADLERFYLDPGLKAFVRAAGADEAVVLIAVGKPQLVVVISTGPGRLSRLYCREETTARYLLEVYGIAPEMVVWDGR